jgi:hypothetical protein
MKSLPLALIFVMAFLTLAYIPVFWRTWAMRALAVRWGMSYLGKQLPKSFSMDRRHFPFHGALKMNKAYNVVAGERNGREVVIFDSTFGGSHGYFCTFLAVHAGANPFGDDTSPWKLVESKGWFALCRTRYLQIPWTMSIRQIEDRLQQL